MKYKNIKWSKDFLPEYHKYLTFLKKVYRHEFRKNGFKRISTPMIETKDFIEKTWAIKNSIIDNVDIDIRQKPYIWIIKAYLNYNLSEEIQPIYFYFMESFLKKIWDDIEEKILIWTEIIWEDDPILDAIQIYINYKVLNDIWLSDKFVIKINSIWIEKEKNKFKEELINFYDNKRNILTKQSEKLIDINPLLILQSNDEDEKILNQNAPKVAQKFLKKDSKLHYQKFKEYLELLKIPFIEDNNLVSEDQNHVKTIWSFEDLNWEIITNWYRHNSVTKNIWEIKEIPATGFWTDTEKVIEMLMQSNLELKNKDKIDLFFVQLWDEAKKVVLPISIKAREAWINTVISLWTPSMKEQMLKAQKSEAKFVVMVWVMEAKNGVFQVRNQVNWSQCEVKKDELIDYIIWKIWKENLDFYSPIDDLTNKKV